ncbi:MAG: plasmid stabilization protein [Planctomycetales bacterium 4484_113]|nr:MAG: plasmid stabilization protein [Planctomycetales bacterium 4484_113]
MYELLLTRNAHRSFDAADKKLAARLKRCFEQLRDHPLAGPNVRRLRGKLEGCYRYRVGDWRVVYQVNEETRTVTVLLIVHRSKAY